MKSSLLLVFLAVGWTCLLASAFHPQKQLYHSSRLPIPIARKEPFQNSADAVFDIVPKTKKLTTMLFVSSPVDGNDDTNKGVENVATATAAAAAADGDDDGDATAIKFVVQAVFALAAVFALYTITTSALSAVEDMTTSAVNALGNEVVREAGHLLQVLWNIYLR